VNLEQRAKAFLKLARYTGREVSADFLRKTSDHFPKAGITRIHHLIEGIYKPAEDDYALCIWSRSAAGHDTEIYPDDVSIRKDGTWTMNYAAKSGNLEVGVNRSLFNCMKDNVPILVIVTTKPSGSPGGAKYRLLGPALIEDFNPANRRFSLIGCSAVAASELSRRYTQEEAAQMELRSRLIVPFQVGLDRAQYQSSRKSREHAFRHIILEEYRCQCSVCQAKFLLRQDPREPLVEAEAAHIIPVEHKGPDDPRNGLSLCRRHHWAFDKGLFTITDGRDIKVSPAVLRAERRRFDLEEYDGSPMTPPASEACHPDEQALHWHQEKVYRST